MSKDNKGQGNWQKNNQQGQQGQNKSGSCECPVGSGNSQHKGGSHRDERGKYNNQPNNENKGNHNGNNGRKFENE